MCFICLYHQFQVVAVATDVLIVYLLVPVFNENESIPADILAYTIKLISMVNNTLFLLY